MKNMMGAVKKAQEFSGKAKEMQQELVDTEIEASAREGMVTVVMNGSQKPVSVQVSDEFMKLNTEEASKVLTECVVAAHKKSYDYAQDRMKNLAQSKLMVFVVNGSMLLECVSTIDKVESTSNSLV